MAESREEAKALWWDNGYRSRYQTSHKAHSMHQVGQLSCPEKDFLSNRNGFFVLFVSILTVFWGFFLLLIMLDSLSWIYMWNNNNLL